MLNQPLYHKIHYLEPNTKSKWVVTTTPLVAGVTINSVVFDLPFTELAISL